MVDHRCAATDRIHASGAIEANLMVLVAPF
jgi:hypothetical protein